VPGTFSKTEDFFARQKRANLFRPVFFRGKPVSVDMPRRGTQKPLNNGSPCEHLTRATRFFRADLHFTGENSRKSDLTPNFLPFQAVLLSGSQLLQAQTATGAVSFTVKPDGTVSFPASEDSLLSGAGRRTLIVKALS
jgi:hypothetical protein